MWSIYPAEKFRFRAWSDEELSVVYNAVTGDTHLIESPGLELLQLLAEAPRTAKTLAVELAGLFSDADQAKVLEFIGATLLQLQSVGLVHDSTR